jgi:hypothetical protein
VTATKDDLTVLSRIRWRIFYKDEEGAVVEKSRYRLSKPDITPDPEEEEADKDEEEYSFQPVFDIITHVTVRDVVATESVSTEAAAADAGKGDDTGGTDQPSKNFKIRSVDTSHMVIRSKPLIEAIKAVVTYYPDQELGGSTITVDEPYYMLLHYQKELGDYLKHDGKSPDETSARPENANEDSAKSADAQGYHDFKVLQAYLDAGWKKKIDREVTRYKDSSAKATFDMLWKLFRPGTRVFTKDRLDDSDEQFAGYIVRSLGLSGMNGHDPTLSVNLWYLDNTGK